jgi:hypothetical protein
MSAKAATKKLGSSATKSAKAKKAGRKAGRTRAYISASKLLAGSKKSKASRGSSGSRAAGRAVQGDSLAKKVAKMAQTIDELKASVESLKARPRTTRPSPPADAPTSISSPLVAKAAALVGSKEAADAWMAMPNPDLGGKAPVDFIGEGKSAVVSDLLDAALAGEPG